MFSIQFLKPLSILEIFFQKNLFLTPLTALFWKKNLKILTFWKSSMGACGTCLVPNFWIPFQFWIFFKIIFWPPYPPFLKKLKILTFLKIFFGDMWHMFSIQFLKLFSILEIFFQTFHFLTLLTPFFRKNLKFWLFWKSSLVTCSTCLVSNFWSPFQFWRYFFKIFVF